MFGLTMRGNPHGPPFEICIAVDSESPHSWQNCAGRETAVEYSDTRLSAGAVVTLCTGYGYGLGLRLLLDAEAEYPTYGTTLLAPELALGAIAYCSICV
jgi:hypothetical protein